MSAKSKTSRTDQTRTTPRVRLELARPEAREVFVAGSFNDWHPTVTPMIRLDDGRWAKELSLPPGRYEYRFVVDGVWTDDPAAKELVPNSYGGVNAVLIVAAGDAATSGPQRLLASSRTSTSGGQARVRNRSINANQASTRDK